MRPHECLSTSRPTCPDLWMITGKSTKMKRLGGAEVSVPSISLLLPLMRQRNSKYFHRHTDQDGRIYFVMATYRPKPVPPGLLQRFVRTVNTKNVGRLCAVLVDAGVVTTVDNVQAPHHFHVDQYRAIFEDWCLQWVQPGEQRASCSCWIHAWKGHCSHAYRIFVSSELGRRTGSDAARCHWRGLR